MPFEIIREDITNLKTDVIVNSTNNKLKASGGVCGAIFKKAGLEKLQKECDKIGHIETSQAVITKGYDLDCKYIIHTVGPIWHGGGHDEEKLLYNTYLTCLNLFHWQHALDYYNMNEKLVLVFLKELLKYLLQ